MVVARTISELEAIDNLNNIRLRGKYKSENHKQTKIMDYFKNNSISL